MGGGAGGGAGARWAGGRASAPTPRPRPHSLTHCMAVSCLRFFRVKDFCDACVSLLLLEVYTIFEKEFTEARTCSRFIVFVKLVLHLFVTFTRDVNVNGFELQKYARGLSFEKCCRMQ